MKLLFGFYEDKQLDACVDRLKRVKKIIEVEVYFGWTMPHKASDNSFLAE